MEELLRYALKCAVYGAVSGMGICLLLLFTTINAPFIKRTLERFKGGRGFALVALALVFTLYGGSKSPKPTVTFPKTDIEVAYLVNSGSYVTNDAVYVSFTKSPIVPLNADLKGYYAPFTTNTEAEVEWTQFYDGYVSDFPQFIEFANATNYNFQFFTTWTPAPTVHTNGVLNVNWGVADNQDMEDEIIALPIQTEVWFNADFLATPEPYTNGVFTLEAEMDLINTDTETNEEGENTNE